MVTFLKMNLMIISSALAKTELQISKFGWGFFKYLYFLFYKDLLWLNWDIVEIYT